MEIKQWMKNIIKFLVSVLFISLLFFKININDMKEIMGIVKIRDLCICVGIYFVSVMLNAVKWSVLLPDLSVFRLLKSCFKAQFYSVVLPGQLFGEVSKVVDLKGDMRSQGQIISSVVVDKLTALIGTMLVGIVGLIFTEIEVPTALRVLFAMMLVALILVMISGRLPIVENMTVSSSYYLWKNAKYKIKCIGKKIYKLYTAWRNYAGNGSVLFHSVLWGVGNQIVGVFQIWLLSDRMSLDVSYLEYCWIMPAVSIILLLPVSFGGLGVREISLSGFLALFDVRPEKAVVIAMVLLACQIAAAFVGMITVGYDWIKSSGNKGEEMTKL